MRRIAVPTPCRYATAWCWPLIHASTFGFVVVPCPQSPLSGTRPRRRPRSLRVADAMIKASAALGAPTLTRLEGASRDHMGLSRGRGRTCRMPNASVSLWSCSCCSGARGPALWRRKVSKRGGAALPCCVERRRRGANPPPERSPRLVAQGPQVSQANACACPAITCSALQRSPACQVSCARGKSAYCQCGSCNGIRLSSANVCVCQ
jgi:hypothetical protein